jgi:transposase
MCLASAPSQRTILCEVGTDLSRFRNASAFASWLGLCPEKQISGAKVLYTRTRPVRNRVALALRLSANSLHHADNYLGHFFRRMKRRIGKPPAVTATAHKLARIIFHLLTNKEEYDDSIFFDAEKEASIRVTARLRKQAAALGFQLLPAASANV